MGPQIRFVERRLQVEEYRALRRAVGWWDVSPEAARAGLPNDLFTLVVERDGETIGCARIIGDGGIYFYLQDVIVLPQYQGQGIGAELMDRVMGWLAANTPPRKFVGLMAASGAEAFYERYGFVRRADNQPGMYLRPERADASEATS